MKTNLYSRAVAQRSSRLVVVLAALSACSSDARAPAPTPSPSSAQDAGSVAFDDGGTLTLSPGADVDVVARVSPPDGRAVRFALLDDPADSSLHSPEVPSDADGLARTRLRAASRAVAFRVRATAGAAAATRSVSVGGQGFAAIVVTPRYQGKRAAAAWTATATTAARCSDLSAPVRPDGPLAASAAMRIDGVPVGARVVVGVRAGHAIGGCAELDDLSLGEVRSLSVTAVDAPLIVAPLTASFRVDGAAGPPAGVATEWRERFMQGLLGGAPTPWSALLDAIATGLPAAQAPGFLAAREAGGWDADAHALTPGASAELGAWLDAGVARLTGGFSVEGTLKSESLDGPAVFAPKLAGGAPLDPASSPPRGASWAALPGDVARASLELSVPPARLLAAAVEAEAGASGDVTLAATLGCAPLSKALAAQSASSCDAACFLAACHAATQTMWQRARRGDEIVGRSATLTVTATLDATADAEARLTSAVGVATVKAASAGEQWSSDATATLSVQPP